MVQKGLTFIIGGTKSGKSAFAEDLFSRDERICYVATGVSEHPDTEMQLRIKRHQARRSAKWQTAEQFKNLDKLVMNNQLDGYLIDDLTMMVTNLFYQRILTQTKSEQLDDYLMSIGWEKLGELSDEILNAVKRLLAAQLATKQKMVIVSDEVGLGVVPATKQTRILRDLYGQANQLVAKAAEQAYFVISGLPQKLK
ncbi:bifunctional adenosylcobinamide kinase/adenosylcobinamide-phosphate guanylyltransferase [Lactobacillus sp. 3B(2020)]|uniref:bifunctional adenosylcobinamide kinase/adenosylcobinamide-phosphate guanylyltransferase n=1 Tax=Lactobacillus sp. 3B(2020) TaxID=2695882 RepID=UPI0015DD7108|nr:bifunctional adenosylcobinamide kinase/adenosylcobinamide-phosphate guanylyltransferase [Lactobacillus sp. 3B(2020)]QLL69189.1 adenosylcobinamide kinase [Lactobacillus sp. 3B(2020)]